MSPATQRGFDNKKTHTKKKHKIRANKKIKLENQNHGKNKKKTKKQHADKRNNKNKQKHTKKKTEKNAGFVFPHLPGEGC